MANEALIEVFLQVLFRASSSTRDIPYYHKAQIHQGVALFWSARESADSRIGQPSREWAGSPAGQPAQE